MTAPERLWREGPPFSMRLAVGSVVCVAVGHHAPRPARQLWIEESRSWTAVADDAHAHVCSRCGRTTSYRFGSVTFR